MNLTALKTLVRIKQVGSFSKAADLEHITLSALSMQIKALESALNVDLFDRTFRPPALTPIGKKVAAHAALILQAERNLLEVCASGDVLVGRFRVGFIQSIFVRVMPGFLKRARHEFHHAEFVLSSGLSESLMEQVRLGGLDAAIVTRVAGAESNLHFETLGWEKMAFAVPREFSEVKLSDAAEALPFIHFRPSSGIGRLVQRVIGSLDTKPTDIIVLDSLEASVECVKESLGFTLLPLPDIQRCGYGQVHIHEHQSPEMSRDLALAVRRENEDAEWVKALAERLALSFDASSGKNGRDDLKT